VLADVPPVRDELVYANHRARLRAVQPAQPHAQPLLPAVPARDKLEPGPTTRSGTSCAAACRARSRACRPGRRSRRASRRCAASSPSRCASAAVPRRRRGAHRAADRREGLNLAASDVGYLAQALPSFYATERAGIDAYSARCLARIWKAERFSWWFTSLMHRFPDTGAFEQRMAACGARVAGGVGGGVDGAGGENYVGLPL
jgi:p-hydroxybenzoate 3-monooxygenase